MEKCQVGRIQVIAFQSSDGKQNHLSRPISLSPVYRNSVIDVESSLSSSDNLSGNVVYGPGENPEQDTGDSMVAGALKVQVQHLFVTKVPKSGCLDSIGSLS